MQGTWSMVFRGKEANINTLMEKVNALDKNGEYKYVLEQWYQEMNLSSPNHDGEVELRIEEGNSGAINDMPNVLEAFCRMAPGVEGALYDRILDDEDFFGSFAYFAPDMEQVIMFDPIPVWDEEEEEDGWFDEELGANTLIRYGNREMFVRVPQKYVFVVALFEDIIEGGQD